MKTNCGMCIARHQMQESLWSYLSVASAAAHSYRAIKSWERSKVARPHIITDAALGKYNPHRYYSPAIQYLQPGKPSTWLPLGKLADQVHHAFRQNWPWRWRQTIVYARSQFMEFWNQYFFSRCIITFCQVQQRPRDGKYQSTHTIPRNPSLFPFKSDRDIKS